jgi:hypothetical protein
MAFFSYLTLAANRDYRAPSRDELNALFDAAGVSKPTEYSHGGYNLHADIWAIFDDPTAQQKNDRFFCPDTIAGNPKIKVTDFDGEYEGPGYSIRISGNGYFFPWSNEDLRQRVLSHPKLVKLAALVQQTFGGHFERPNDDSELWDRMIIDTSTGWAWLRHES